MFIYGYFGKDLAHIKCCPVEELSSDLDHIIQVSFEGYEIMEMFHKFSPKTRAYRYIDGEKHREEIFQNWIKHDPLISKMSPVLKNHLIASIGESFHNHSEFSIQNGGDGLAYPTFCEIWGPTTGGSMFIDIKKMTNDDILILDKYKMYWHQWRTCVSKYKVLEIIKMKEKNNSNGHFIVEQIEKVYKENNKEFKKSA